jgi:hypothetical protein
MVEKCNNRSSPAPRRAAIASILAYLVQPRTWILTMHLRITDTLTMRSY